MRAFVTSLSDQKLKCEYHRKDLIQTSNNEHFSDKTTNTH